MSFLPLAAKSLEEAAKVRVHACKNSIGYFAHAELANQEDYHAEYLAQEIAVKVVSSFDKAISHINEFTSDHTEVIISQDLSRTQSLSAK